jgi:FkbM family methyltransferase
MLRDLESPLGSRTIVQFEISRQNLNNRIVFAKQNRRLDTGRAIINWIIAEYLGYLSKRHTSKNTRQLAIFSFDHIGHSIMLNRVYGLDDLEIFFEWLASVKPQIFQGTAVDIGANIGNHSLYFSDLFRSVYSFEPHPRAFALLSFNSELNSNITPVNIGISDVAGKLYLCSNVQNIGNSRLSEVDPGSAHMVRVATLDESIDPAEDITLIKLDVEGHELKALLGSKKIIGKRKPIIMFEQQKNDFSNGSTAVIDLLRGFGYKTFMIVKKYPSSRFRSIKLLRYAYSVISRIVFSPSICLELVEYCDPEFYPFIAAIPDWVSLPGGRLDELEPIPKSAE